MIFKFADCELDTDQHELRRDGSPVPIQPQVFDLLFYLLENADRAVTKDDIVEHVWKGRIVSDTTISSRIKAARRAIGDSGSEQSLIKTLHGTGFRFHAKVTGAESVANSWISSEDERTSIAVFPFSMSGFEGQRDYLGQGLAEEISYLLAHLRWLRVIDPIALLESPSGTRQAVPTRYILDGSIRRSGSQARILAKLVRKADSEVVWSEGYVVDEENLGGLQDDISLSVAGAIEPELAEIESLVAARKSVENQTAWDLWLQGRAKLFEFTDSSRKKAMALFEKAVEIQPNMARAWAGLAYASIQEAFYGDPVDRQEVLDSALDAARRSVTEDGKDPFCHFALGRAYSLLRRFDDAERETLVAGDLARGFSLAYFGMGFTLVSRGRAGEAIRYFDRFQELSPWHPHIWTCLHMRAIAHYWLGETEDAERDARNAVAFPNATRWPFMTLTSILGSIGAEEESREVLARLYEQHPGFSIEAARDDFFFMDDPENVERYLQGLRNAGVPEDGDR